MGDAIASYKVEDDDVERVLRLCTGLGYNASSLGVVVGSSVVDARKDWGNLYAGQEQLDAQQREVEDALLKVGIPPTVYSYGFTGGLRAEPL